MALAEQRHLAELKKRGAVLDDFLILLEHEPVLTLGRGTDPSHLVASAEWLRSRGVRCVEIERGGDVTYHGPGQLVGYPVLDLGHYRRDLHWYLRRLEEALLVALAALGVPAFRVVGHTGVWVGSGAASRPGDRAREGAERELLEGRIRKIASIGVHAGRWVTSHGFALNVTNEPLEHFDLIVPCGIRGVRMTSLEAEGASLESPADPRLVEAIGHGFEEAFGCRTERAELAALPGVAGAAASRPGDATDPARLGLEAGDSAAGRAETGGHR